MSESSIPAAPAVPSSAAPPPVAATPLGSLHHWYEVVSVLVTRDHRARYRSAGMGVAWAVASPLLFLLTFYMIFGVVMQVNIPHYASFVFTGIVGWNWLQTSLNEGVASISQNASLVAHPGFPVQALPMVSTISNLINFCFALPILLAVALIERGGIGWTVLFLPLIMAVQLVLILSLAFFVSAANVFFRDVQHILPVLLQLGYFMTPIFYDLGQLPGPMAQVLALNPMTQIITAYRMSLAGEMPDLAALAVVLGVALVLLVLGHRYFRNAAERFLEEI
jgi:ABC-type polysaccharide/polyol phosphate export permease